MSNDSNDSYETDVPEKDDAAPAESGQLGPNGGFNGVRDTLWVNSQNVL